MSAKMSALVKAAGLCAAVAMAAASARVALAAGGAPAVVKEKPAAAAPAEPAPEARKRIGEDELAPDDHALRYYAALNQTERVTAEISRLQRLYPGFEPPADLYTAPQGGGVDEEPLWALFSADRTEEVRAAIAAKQRELPTWKPSDDLTQKLHRKELRKKITAFWKDGRWQDLVDFVKTENLSALEAEVDLLWTVAEAFARTKQTADSVAVYKSIITSSKDKQIRIASVQKAMSSLRMNDVEALLAAMPVAADGTRDYQGIMVDVTRARIAAYLHDERAEEIPAQDMAQFEAYARESREADQLGLVAWYDYKRRDFPNALEWFKAAIQNGGDAMIAHGLAHTLRALNMLREAEEVSFAWREPLANNIILYLDLLERDLTRETPPYIEPERLARYAKVTMEVASGEGAQALAWYAYNSCQYDVALSWFEKAMAWFPKDATAYGYALSLGKVKKKNDKSLYEIANRYDGLFPKVIEILFPDGYYHPPTPCDTKQAAKLHGAAIKMGAYVVPGPANLPQAGAGPNDGYAYLNQKNASAPVNQNQVPQDVQLQRILKTLKGKFPAPVATENPFRFRSIPMANGPRPYGAATPPAPDIPLQPDPARGPGPLVARRVPGVGAMPYEHYGFSLLPGWNGVETASWPPASQQIAPAGTQWASQESDPARAGITSYDSRHNNAYGANAYGARGPAVPPPSAGGGAGGPPPPRPGAPPPRPTPAYGANAYGARGPAVPPPSAGGAPGLPPQPAPGAPPPRQTPVYGQYPQPMSR